MSGLYEKDPTRPQPPAFTKMTPQVDIMDRRAKRMAKGGLGSAMKAIEKDKRKGGAGAGTSGY